MKWNQSKSFKRTQRAWYKKLAKSGFVDAEQDEYYLKQPAGKVRVAVNKVDRNENGGVTLNNAKVGTIAESNKYNYYLKCRMFLQSFKFKSKFEKQVFEMHTEGLGHRVIAKKLKTYRRKVQELLLVLIKE